MLIDHIDGENRRIYLSASSVGVDINPIDIYKEMRTLRKNDESLRKYDVFIKAYGNVEKGAGKYTERYIQLLQGTKIVPYATTHVMNIVGTIITDDGHEGVYAFDRSSLPSGIVVDINYVPPQVEIITINTSGVQAQEVWDYPQRTLTSGTVLAQDVNVVEVGGNAVTSVDDFKADVSNIDLSTIPSDVWSYVSRELTVSAGLTPAQEAKLNDILLNTDSIPTDVWTHNNRELTNIQSDVKFVNGQAVNTIDDFKADVSQIPTLLDIENSTILAKESSVGLVKTIVETLPDLQDISQDFVNINFGKLEITNNQMMVYAQDGTLLVTYDLFDNNGNPTMNQVYRREVV